MANTINTRIQLKNDTIENWDGSQLSLLQGEVALAKLSGDLSGKYEIRIGDGEKTFTGLGSNVVIPSENVIGLEDTVKSLSATHYTFETKAKLDALTGMNPGDTAVVRETITGDKVSYTAYVFDGTVNEWTAMDGNYDASNVYFKNDMTFTTNIGTCQLATGTTKGTLSAAGKSLEELIRSLIAKTIPPTITQPKYTLAAEQISTDTNDVEIGSYIKRIKWDGTFTDGTYSYGYVGKEGSSQSAGCSPSYSITINKDVSAIVSGSLTSVDGSADLSVPLQISSTSDTTYVTVTGVCKYTGSTRIPVNNIGDGIEISAIAANDTGITKTANVNVTGKRKHFYLAIPTANAKADVNTITGAEMRAGTGDFSVKTSFTVPAGTKQVFIALTKGSKSSLSIKNESALGAPVACSKLTNNIFIEGANGFTAAEYNVWCVNLDGEFGGEANLTLTWSK